MSETRMNKNKKIHQKLKQEEQEQFAKTIEYEKKVKSIDPVFDDSTTQEENKESSDDDFESFDKSIKERNLKILANAEKSMNAYLDEEDEEDEDDDDDNNEKEIEVKNKVAVKEHVIDKKEVIDIIEKPVLNYEYSKEYFEKNKEIGDQPVSFSDKISVEELLRVRIEEQEQIKQRIDRGLLSPTNNDYTSEMMQTNINIVEGVNIRRLLKYKIKKETDVVEKTIFIMLMFLVVVGFLLLVYLFIFK